MAELFDVEVPTVNEHLKTLFESGEIDPAATIRKFRIVRQEDKRHARKHAALRTIPILPSPRFGNRTASRSDHAFPPWSSGLAPRRNRPWSLIQGFRSPRRRFGLRGGGTRASTRPYERFGIPRPIPNPRSLIIHPSSFILHNSQRLPRIIRPRFRFSPGLGHRLLRLGDFPLPASLLTQKNRAARRRLLGKRK